MYLSKFTKCISIVLCALILCTLMPLQKTEAASAEFTAYVESVTANVGQQVVVPIKLANVPSNGITTADMTITYDPSKLEYVNGSAGSIVMNPSVNFAINKENNGTIKILFLDETLLNEYIREDGIFANITFKVLGTSTVTISKATFGDRTLKPMTAKLNAGTITINGGATTQPTTPPTPTPTVRPTTPPTVPPTVPPTTPPVITGFTAYVESVTANAGQQVVVPIKLANVPSNGITTADMTIIYDPSKLEYVNGSAGSIVMNPSVNFAINKEDNGIIKILFLDETLLNEYIREDGIFANITFKALGTSTVTISKATFGDRTLKPMTAKLNAGTVTVNGGATTQPTTPPTPTPTVRPTTPPTVPPTVPPTIPPVITGFTAYVESVTANAGQQVVVPIKLANVPSNGITTADMTIIYDPSKLEYVNGSAGSIIMNPSVNFAIHKENNGTIKILFLDETLLNEYIREDGIFANITFKALGTSTVTISKATFGDRTLKPMTVKLNAGTVTVNGGATTQPTTSPTPTPTPTLTPPPQSGNFSVNYTQSDWGTGATVSMTITNNGSTAVNGWTVRFNFDGNQKITNAWNCSFTQNGNSIVLTNVDYNATIPAGGSVTIGFNISYTGTNKAPTNFIVNATSSGGTDNPVPTPPPSQNNNCSVTYTHNDWGSGATVSITIKNNGSTAVNGWTVNFTYAGNQKITNAWNCSYTQNGNSVTLKNVDYNSTIPAGGTITIGFNITYSGTNSIPTNITVN
ncbi:cohesin domain-containing protein [Acetivibrio clariflavus]|uniref:Cellobiohydrolase A (1,4-beta-cellobiosidase A) n=1 Tax=Acetivibrio clariflavus (strain DSM 19732 / NBRC 101661 / EBR45) TaxID=720554 RepID=G8LUE1_ACECE|nr:cohesin domain-containing protein [Acetivibrio clariflavus]AEV70589.1 cellobiohydrolase A (1,4-beta-cellobiosidase A) [Acetivibrio clariflavus DSM 19732]